MALVSLEQIRQGYTRPLDEEELDRKGGRSNAARDSADDSPSFAPIDQFASGFGAGVDQQQALAGATKAAVGSAIGDDEMKQAGFDYYRQQMEEAAENAPISGFDDATDSLSDFGNFVFYTLGNAIPSLATTAAGGGVGGVVAKQAAKTLGKETVERLAKEKMEDAAQGIVDEAIRSKATNAYKEQVANKFARMGVATGSGVASAQMGFGESFARIYEETGLEDPGTALAAGIASGVMDMVGAPFRAVRTAFPDNPKVLTELKEYISDKALTTDGRKRLGNMLNEGFKSAGVEGLTEASQEFISRASVMWAKENLSESDQALFNGYLFNEEAVQSYFHAAAAGAIAGTALGGTIGGFRRVDAEDGTSGLDTKREEERQQRQLEGKRAVIAAAEAPIDVEPESETATDPSRVSDTLETIEISAGVSRDDLAKDNALTGEQQQEILDILIDQGRIKSEISGDKILYTAVDDVDPQPTERPPELEIVQPEELDLATRARMSAQLFGEFTFSDIQRDLRIGFNPTVNALKPLIDSGQVVSIGDGRYRFVEDASPSAMAEEEVTGPQKAFTQPEPDVAETENEKLFKRAYGPNYRRIPTFKKYEGADLTDPDIQDAILKEDVSSFGKGSDSPRYQKMQAELAKIRRDSFEQMDSGEPIGLAGEVQSFIRGDQETDDGLPASQERIVAAQNVVPTRFVVAGETSIDRPDDGRDIQQRISTLNQNVGVESEQPAGTDTLVTQQIPSIGELVRQLSGKGEAPRVKASNGLSGLIPLEPVLGSIVSGDMPVNDLLDLSPQVRRLLNSFVDIFERGMPSDAMTQGLNGVYVINRQNTGIAESALAINFNKSGSLGINPDFLAKAAKDAVEGKKLISVLSHEMWHQQDTTKKYSEYLPGLRLRVEQAADTDSYSLSMGDVVSEIFDQWEAGTELGEVFNYPFTYVQLLQNKKIGDFSAVSETLRREVFAQLGATYISNPGLLEQSAPKAYRLMRDIQRDPRSLDDIFQEARDRARDADTAVQETDTTGERAGVSGEVRAPPGTGGIQVPDDGGAGVAGSAGDQGQQAGGGLGDALTEPSRDESGRLPEVEDDFDAIVEEKQYLYQKSKGKVRGKSAITKVIGPKNADKQLPALRELSSRHQNSLDSPASWLRFERDLTGSNETLRPPHGLIKLYNNPEEWASVHSKLSGEQLEAARAGLNTAKELGELYEQGVVTPDVTAKLMLWGMMSRMLTASAQEAGFVDMVFSAKGQNRSTFEDFADKSLMGEFTDADVADWKEFVPSAITEGSFGRAGTSNANDFGRFLQKMSEMDDSGITKLQKLHDLVADRSISSAEVRRQFQGMTDGIGIDNKVFSFLLLMTGRDDVVILDRIQLNTMWDSGRYGKLIYDDIAENFNGLHGLARYEALESALSSRIQDLYTAIGRPDEASVGRYHWESWVLNSGQVVAHPTMQGIVNDIRGDESPYAYLGAPEGKQNMLRYGAIYARDTEGDQYFLYPDSTGKVYRLTKSGFGDFIKEIRKPKNGILPKGFKVSEYDKGFPWYEAEGVNRDNLDKLLESYAEREATQVERSFEETVQDGEADVSRPGDLDPPNAQEADAPDSMDFMLYDDDQKKIAPFKLFDDITSDVSLANRYKTKTQNVRQKVVDRLERLKQAEDEIANRLGLDRLPSEISAYDAENLMHSKAQKQLEDFEVEYVETIGEAIKGSGLSMDQVGLYLLAKHAPERNRVIAQKEQEQRAAQIAKLEEQIESATETDEPTGALEQRLNKLQEAPFRFQDTGSGMTDADAQTVLDKAESDGMTDTLEGIAERVYSMLDDMRQNMVDKGLLDEETRADWQDTYEFYVPLKGFASYPEGLEMRSGVGAAGFSVKGSESFKAKGRVTLPVNPLLVSFKDAEEKIIRAERNVIAQRLLALLQQNESEDNWQVFNNRFRPDDPANPSEKLSLARMKTERRVDDGLLKYIQVKRGGQTFFIEVKDRELNRQLQSSGVGMFNSNVDFMNKVLTNLTKFQNFRRNMLINYNPSWGLVNPLRDIQTGLAFALSEEDTVGGRIQGQELIGKISSGYGKSLRAFWRNRRGSEGANDTDREYDQYVKEYVEDGAPTGLSLTKSLAEQSRRFEKVLTQGDLRKKVRYMTDLVEDYNQTMENAVRLSTYVEARKSGTARADAATLAKDLTVNFNRKGEYSSAIDSLYLFFNAAVQGNVNIAKAILRPGSDGQTITKARLVAGSMVAWGFTRTLMNMDFGGEDDDGELKYADFNEYALKTSMVLINPFSETQQAYAMPMPYGYGIFDNIGRYGAELAMGVKTPQEIAVDLTLSVDHHFNPLSLHASKDDAGLVEAAVQKGIGLTPDIIEAFAEQLGNINFFGSDITIPQNSFLVEKPPSEPTKRGTSEYISAATRFLNQVTDGNEDVTGGLSVSPERVQHVVEFLLGGVGRFFDDSADTVAKLISEEPDLRSTDLPILRTFMPLPSEYSDRIDFYQNRDSFRQHEKSFKSQTTREGRREVIDDRGYNIPQFAAFDQKIEKALRKLRDQKNKLENNELIDPLKRYEAIERIAQQEERLYDEYNKRWRKEAQ